MIAVGVDGERAIGLDHSLRRARDEIEQNKFLIIGSRDAFVAWLDGFLARFAAEAKRRNLALHGR